MIFCVKQKYEMFKERVRRVREEHSKSAEVAATVSNSRDHPSVIEVSTHSRMTTFLITWEHIPISLVNNSNASYMFFLYTQNIHLINLLIILKKKTLIY